MSFRTRLLAVLVGMVLFVAVPRASEAVHLMLTDVATDEGADLLVTKSGPSSAAAGSDVSFDVVVMNGGPDDATTVTLTDAVPAGMTFVSATQNSGPAFSCSTPAVGRTGTITCTIATLVAGASADFTFVMHIPVDTPPGTTFTNKASRDVRLRSE